MEIAQKNFTTEKRFPIKTFEFNPKMNDSENTHDSRLTTHVSRLITDYLYLGVYKVLSWIVTSGFP